MGKQGLQRRRQLRPGRTIALQQIQSARDQLGNRCTGCSATSASCGTTSTASDSSRTTSRRTRTSAAGIANSQVEKVEKAEVGATWTQISWLADKLVSCLAA